MRPAVIQACNDLQLTAGWVTPFFRVSEGVPKMSELKKFIAPFLAPNVKVVLQIMGNDPAKLAETARRGMAAGADGIDLNCGCPSAQVVRHGAGAACMQNMDNTARIIEAVRRAVPESFFSVKTRLGFKDRAESAVFLPLWENAGQPDLFTLHYRTAEEGYAPVAGRSCRLREARQLIRYAGVFGNGDIVSTAEALQLCSECALDGVMIGRGFWRDPFILVRHLLSEPLSQEQARRKLWAKLAEIPYRRGCWSLGSAIEMATLIMGSNSAEAVKLKAAFRAK